MKPIPYLYLLAADQGYRLIRTHESGFAEIAHESVGPAGVPQHKNGHSSRDHLAHADMAKTAVAALAAEWAKGGHDRIVIAAGPQMLGLIREAMPKALQARVAAEVHKDLLKTPLHDLASHFGDVPVV